MARFCKIDFRLHNAGSDWLARHNNSPDLRFKSRADLMRSQDGMTTFGLLAEKNDFVF